MKKSRQTRYDSLEDRVMRNSYVSEESSLNGDPCRVWTGATKKNGSGKRYGYFSIRIGGKVKHVFIHRQVVREFQKKRLNRRIVVCHLCNNPLCVNPSHLRAAFQSTNIRQCVEEGRHFTPFWMGDKKND